MKYNTSESKLILPEYGRHVQKLVDHCLTIEDREERTRFAYMIADIIAIQFPNIIGERNDMQKIWDHINIISNFKLDIDFPCPVIEKEELNPKPDKIPYSSSNDNFRHYGKIIKEMLKKVADMENCVEKDQLIFLVANQMKKLLISQNPENASDEKVFKDIEEITRGKITIDGTNYRLNEYIGVAPQSKNKKKKK